MAKWTVRAIQVGSIDLDRSAMTHYKGNIVVMVPETYESFQRIRQFAHYILPGHEPAIEDGSEKFIPVL